MSYLARAVALVAVVLSFFHLYDLFRDLRDARSSIETRQSLRRLSALTIRNFPGRDLDSADLFWKSIGREGNPIRDTWGNEYRLTSRAEGKVRSYFWSSAGPDRIFGTHDDLFVEVPYPNGPGSLPELEPEEPPVPPPVNIDAK